MTIRDQVEELASQIAVLAHPPVYLFGHSWGAWLAYLLAHDFPQLVIKVFLIGAGALDPCYLSEMNLRRRMRLNDVECAEYDQLPARIEEAEGMRKEALLSRLGALAGKADNVCVDDIPENQDDMIGLNAEQYQRIWIEASKLREQGYFVNIAPGITVPIRVVHGADDPTPLAGVVEPIREKLADLEWYELAQCGHEPWKEVLAKEHFWQIIRNEVIV